MSEVKSIVQEFHTEIEPGAYSEADESLPFCENNIVEGDNEDEAEPEETSEASSTIIFK